MTTLALMHHPVLGPAQLHARFCKHIAASTLAWAPALCVAQLAPPPAPAYCPPQVRVAYADTELPPWIEGSGPRLRDEPGLFVRWTRNAIARTGCSAALKEERLPYNRLIEAIERGEVDIRVSAGFRPELDGVARFPEKNGTPNPALAIADGNTTLFVRRDDRQVSWDGQALKRDGQAVVVGTVRGHFSEKVLQQRQWAIDPAPNWDASVRKLLAGRVDVIAGTESVIDDLPERQQLRPLHPPVQYDYFWAPVSRQFLDAHPAFVQKFWLAICRESRVRFRQLGACQP